MKNCIILSGNMTLGVLVSNGNAGSIVSQSRRHAENQHKGQNQSKNLPCYYMTPTITFWRCSNATKKP